MTSSAGLQTDQQRQRARRSAVPAAAAMAHPPFPIWIHKGQPGTPELPKGG